MKVYYYGKFKIEGNQKIYKNVFDIPNFGSEITEIEIKITLLK